jgi:hypothetical protein
MLSSNCKASSLGLGFWPSQRFASFIFHKRGSDTDLFNKNSGEGGATILLSLYCDKFWEKKETGKIQSLKVIKQANGCTS